MSNWPHHRDFVVIEKDEQVTQKHKDTSTLFILENANEDEVLVRAGINRACCKFLLPNDSEMFL